MNRKKLNRIGRWLCRVAGLLALALLLATSALADSGVDPQETLPNKPQVTIQGNVVVDEAGSPTGFYELALCVKSPRKIYGPDPANTAVSKDLSEAEYAQLLADISNGTVTGLTANDYKITYYPFSTASAVVSVDPDVLTAVSWELETVDYAAWDKTAKTYAAHDADYPRGVDTTGSPEAFPAVTTAKLQKPYPVSVALDAEGDGGVFTAAAQADHYYVDANGHKALILTLSAHAPDNAPVVYAESTPVCVIRFSYDLQRFAKGDLKASTTGSARDQYTGGSAANEPGFWLGLDRGDSSMVVNGKTPVTWLADSDQGTGGASYDFSDAKAAATEAGQVVWTKLSVQDSGKDASTAGLETTEYYYYLGADGANASNPDGTVTVNVGGTPTPVEHIRIPDTQGVTVLAAGDEKNPQPGAGDSWSAAGYTYYKNILYLNDAELALRMVNQTTFKKAVGGTGGTTILFYDWDDTLIGSLVVGKGDQRGAVNAYVETTMVHPDLRSSQYLDNGALPAAGTAAAASLTNLTDSLDREYTYRGKYNSKLDGTGVARPDDDDPDAAWANDDPAAPGSEYPLTNKLDYAFYRHVDTVTTVETPAATTGYTQTQRYVTAQPLSSDPDAQLYPYVYGWAIVDEDSARNDKNWQVRRDAGTLEDTWTTMGVGELSGLDPAYDLAADPNGQSVPTAAPTGGSLTTTCPAFVTAPTTPTTYSYLLEGESGYLRLADFSDVERLLTRTDQDTIVVKAVYEPGTALLTGFNYRISTEPYYNKLNGRAANDGGAYYVDFILERSTYEHADGQLRGTSRVRDPAVRQDTTYDQKWIQNLLLGVDHNLDNADLATAIDLSETMFTNVEVISGDEVGVTLSLSARQYTVNYFLTEKYGWNYVAGGTRSASTLLMDEGDGRLLTNYNYDSPDSNTTDIYYDVTQYEDRDGSRGFVLEGTLNYLMEQATQVNRGKIDMPQFRTNADFAEIRDTNLRMDTLGTQPSAGLPFISLQDKIVDAAAWCEANKSADTWDYTRDCAQLSYHQLQYYILGTPYTNRAAADATPISWCHLHKDCAALTSGAPKTWQEVMDAAGGSDPDVIEKMAVADIENITGLRMDAAGGKYTSATTFKNDIVAAVTALKAKGMDTTWLNVQYAIFNPGAPETLVEADAKASFWWYDSALTAKPTARSFSDLVAAAEDYYNGVTLKDGNIVAGWTVKFNGLEDAFNGNQTADGSVGADWLRLTENFVRTWTVNGDGSETTGPYHGGVMTYEDFLMNELLPALKKGIDAGEMSDPDRWYKVQYSLLHPSEPWPTGVAKGDGTAVGDELARYWWHLGGKFLAVTDVKSMLEVALVYNGDGASAWSGFTFNKFQTLSGFDLIRDLRWKFDGTDEIDASDFDKFKDEMVDFVQNSGETNFDSTTNTDLWTYLQYQIIHNGYDMSEALNENNASYYWWKGGATTGTAVALSKEGLGNAGFSSKVNGNTSAWGNLTDGAINNWYYRDPVSSKLDDDSYAAHTDMPALSMTDLKTAVETLVTDRMNREVAVDPTGHHHTPPTLTWLDIQHYVVTGDMDWTGTLDGTADFADETAAKARYWWHSGGKNPNAVVLTGFDTWKASVASGGDSFIDSLGESDFGATDLCLRVIKANGTFSAANLTKAQTRLKSLLSSLSSPSDFKNLTWYQIQYAMLSSVAAQGGGDGATLDATAARDWFINGNAANDTTGKLKYKDWRPSWLKTADPISGLTE